MPALAQFEGRILLWIQDSLRCAPVNALMRLFSFLGDGGMVWIVLTLILLLMKRTRRTGIACALSMVLTLIAVNLILKPLVARTRPYELIEGLSLLVHAHADHSFPSGHSANSFACAWVLFRCLPKKWRVPPLILACLIALSRLFVGVHYPTDVLAGAGIGVLMAEISRRGVRGYVRRQELSGR